MRNAAIPKGGEREADVGVGGCPRGGGRGGGGGSRVAALLRASECSSSIVPKNLLFDLRHGMIYFFASERKRMRGGLSAHPLSA
ncbi:MAG: hypothetical protein IT312_08645 [Anaerolineales bacterium]|nr:hypothetical protein [Anaerolineales bacterium]